MAYALGLDHSHAVSLLPSRHSFQDQVTKTELPGMVIQTCSPIPQEFFFFFLVF